MSFDDYANHIYQKYRLSVAIAILKTKPQNITPMEYLSQLKSNMADKMAVDDDVTICSDDFMMNDGDSDTILLDFDDKIIGDKRNDGTRVLDNEDQNHFDEDLTQATFYDSFQSQAQIAHKAIEPIDNEITYYENDDNTCSQSIIKDNRIINKESINNNTEPNNPLKLKNNSISNDASNVNKTYLEYSNNNEFNLIENSTYDSQKTILYTVPVFTQNYTHYSQSQNEFVIPNNYLYGVNKNNNTTVTNDTNAKEVTNVQNSKVTNTDIAIQNTIVEYNTNMNGATNEKTNVIDMNFQDETYFSNKIASLQNENNQNTSILSQNDKVVNQNQNDFDNSESILKTKHLDNSQNVDEYFNEIHNLNNNTILNEINFETPTEIDKITQHIIEFSHNNEIQSFDFNKNQNETTESNTNKNISQNIESRHAFSQNVETFDEEIDLNEIISYKVLEELNKIKAFLRKKDRRMSSDGFSSDSGYRSDSQYRNSNRSALQLSGASINQSAYCLLNYIMQCSLLSSTRDITQEIAQTLGHLIDRLHEEESYPPFLEEILDGVDILLRQIYKGHTNVISEVLEKDEYMQRILLLNKSIQIQKHSIDKITEMLTQFYENIADKNITYELTNIDEVENVSYIFHILEILLKKYIKSKDTASQFNSQISQDDEKILNKSAITDIWRQKWNPNLKKDNEGNRVNRCVLKKCSEILNKIVVDCVDSYSLVAFSALKCFNSLQS